MKKIGVLFGMGEHVSGSVLGGAHQSRWRSTTFSRSLCRWAGVKEADPSGYAGDRGPHLALRRCSYLRVSPRTRR